MGRYAWVRWVLQVSTRWQRTQAWVWMVRRWGVRRTFNYWRMGQERGWMDDKEADDFIRYVMKKGKGK